MLRQHRQQVVVAPPLACGARDAHEPSPGTVSIEPDHGNLSAVRAAVAELTDQACDVQASSCASVISGLSVGRIETSLMLHLRPWEVRTARAARARKAAAATRGVAVSGETPAPATDPMLDDVLGANEDEGRELLNQLAWFVARDVLERVGELVP